MAEKNLIQKLAAVMLAAERVPKNGRNDFHRYDYATEADIAAAVRKEMGSQGVMLVPDIEKIEWSKLTTKSGEQRLATITVLYTVTDGTSDLKFHVIGEGSDSGDKAVYKALTGATKYALLKLFLLPTGDDPEVDEEHGPRPAAKANGKHAADAIRAAASDPAGRRDACLARLSRIGMEGKTLRAFVGGAIGKDVAATGPIQVGSIEGLEKLEAAVEKAENDHKAQAALAEAQKHKEEFA